MMGQIRRQVSAVIAMAVGAVLLPVLTTTSATANGSAQVTDVRVGNHKSGQPTDLKDAISKVSLMTLNSLLRPPEADSIF